MTTDVRALDAVVSTASSVRISEVEWYREVVVDLTIPATLDGLRAALEISSLPGYVCACIGQVWFEFLDGQGERITTFRLHHGVSLAWQWDSGHGELKDGAELLRWLADNGLPGALLGSHERPERLAWIAAMPPALAEHTGDLVGHWPTPVDSKRIVEARKRVDGLEGVLQVLRWCAAGMGNATKTPPYEDVPGLILRETPIAEIVQALESPEADERHDAGAARILLVEKSRVKQRMDVARLPKPIRARIRQAAQAKGYEVPQWAERLLLNA
ncbi:hypothetical protein ACFWN2_36265 [Lentzea sp. NPDC058436]|uniref:hypothetical protein n=1 Tax=Lentzea sp. NPDC058436 TaxID=3346499 RepID=UPI00365CCBFE